MFEETLPLMEEVLVDVKALFRALKAGTMAGEDPAQIESAIVYIDVIPSYPLVFAGYNELIATGRLRHLDDAELIDLLGNQSAEYDAAQAAKGDPLLESGGPRQDVHARTTSGGISALLGAPHRVALEVLAVVLGRHVNLGPHRPDSGRLLTGRYPKHFGCPRSIR